MPHFPIRDTAPERLPAHRPRCLSPAALRRALLTTTVALAGLVAAPVGAQAPTTAETQLRRAGESPEPPPTWRWRWIGNGRDVRHRPGIDPGRPEANIAFIATDGTIRYGRVAGADATRNGSAPDEWYSIAPPRGFSTSTFAVSPDGFLYLVGRFEQARRSTVLRTRTGRAPEWEELPVPGLGMLFSIDIQSNGTVWLGGERREVFRLDGRSWKKELTPLPYHNFFLRVFDDDTAWIMAETKSVSAIYHRNADGHWSTLARRPGDWLLLHADRDTACIVTREGLLHAPRPDLGAPGIFPHLHPFDRGEVALSGHDEGWLIEGGVLYRFDGAEREALALESTVYRIRHIWYPGDGRLFASDGADGLYVLESAASAEPHTPFLFRPIRHASYADHPFTKGVSVLRMKGKEFLHIIDHENQNPTIDLRFRLESTAPLNPFAWRDFASTLGNGGPQWTSDWRVPYDMAAVTADLNGDGLEDIVLSGLYMGCSFYRNVRDSRFVDWTREARLSQEFMDHSVGVVALDADSDGDLDLFVPNYMVPDRLYLNNGAGRFTEVTAASGLPLRDSSGMATAADLDDDGDTDLVVATWGHGVLVHENLGPVPDAPKFRTQSLLTGPPSPGGESYSLEYFNSVGVADLDGDGLEDLVVAAQSGPPRFLRNHGGLVFVEDPAFLSTPSPAQRTIGASFGDFDHDGDLDLVLTGPATGLYYENRGNHMETIRFGSPESDSIRVYTTGSVVVDFENDGDLDLALGSDRAEMLFLQNRLDDGRSIVLEVVGPLANRSAVGARVDLYEGGRAGVPSSRLQTRRILGAAAYGSSDSKLVHFGGTEKSEAYDVVVRLPGASTKTVTGLSPGRHRVELEPDVPVPLASAWVLPVGNFLRDRWNLCWVGLVALTAFFSLVFIYLLFDRDNRSRWVPVPLLALPIAAVVLYRSLALDPGPLPVAIASGIPFMGTIASLIVARSRTRPTPAPDLVLSLSDALRSFRHNETPRRALDALRMTLNNIPSDLDPTWCGLLAEDLQAYDRIVAPHVRSMIRMAQAGGLPVSDIEPILRRHRSSIPRLTGAVSTEGRSGGAQRRLQGRLERFSEEVVRLNDWLTRMRAETDERLAVPAHEVLQEFVTTRRRRIPCALELLGTTNPGTRVRFRREDLEQVLDVLLDNAVAALVGSREKLVSIRTREEQPGTLTVYFMDSGHGIDASIRDRVFERGITGSGKPGRGMGLYYARRTVERFGGRISIVDIADAGACFAIELEQVRDPHPEVEA
jgi:signal transduction histidine kinase